MPATIPPRMTTPSQTSPAASTRWGAAPKGDSSPTSAASLTPIPPWVSGKSAASFASGHAKNQSRSGRNSPQEMASSAVSVRNVVCIAVPRIHPKNKTWGRRETLRSAKRNRPSRRLNLTERPRSNGRYNRPASTIAIAATPANKYTACRAWIPQRHRDGTWQKQNPQQHQARLRAHIQKTIGHISGKHRRGIRTAAQADRQTHHVSADDRRQKQRREQTAGITLRTGSVIQLRAGRVDHHPPFRHTNGVRQQVADQDDDKSRQRYALNGFTKQMHTAENAAISQAPPSRPAIVR